MSSGWRDMSSATLFNIGGYMACSGSLLVVNKVALYNIPNPGFVLLLQVLGTAIAVKSADILGVIADCDKLEVSKVFAFMPVALIFTATVLLNMCSLQYANVETFMVFRFSTPLAISVAEYLWMGRELPDRKSWAALLVLLVGGLGYTFVDAFFDIRGYIFCLLWFVVFCVDQLYLKHIVDTVKMDSTWGRVFYSNLLSCVPLILVTLASDPQLAYLANVNFVGVVILILSVGMGAAMSYFGWSARGSVSATTFTVIGNVCKILTTFLNLAIWDKHASFPGLICLLVSFIGASYYKQAPLREAAPAPAGKPEAQATPESFTIGANDVELQQLMERKHDEEEATITT